MIRKNISWKKKLLSYYNLFFYKYIREKTFKLKKKFEGIQDKNKKKLRGNVLTYFLIRYQRRFKRAKHIPRLKKIHWAIPSYMHFDPLTLRAVLLYPPKPNQIHYSFKCSLISIASFYKSLAL